MWLLGNGKTMYLDATGVVRRRDNQHGLARRGDVCRYRSKKFVIHFGVHAGCDIPLASQPSRCLFQMPDLHQGPAQQGAAVDGQARQVVDVGVC